MAKDYNFGTSVDTLTTIITALDQIQTALKKQRAEHIEALKEVHAQELAQAAAAAAAGKTTPAAAPVGTGA
jgi:hypothetical protein